MANNDALMLFFAAHIVASSSMIIASSDVQTESNLPIQSLPLTSNQVQFMFSQSIFNATGSNLMQKEIEVPHTDSPKVNKMLWVICAMWFGCCGIDRCFMGQICYGVLKGCTFGGFFIWYLIDYWVCFALSVTKKTEIRMVGYDIAFEKSSIDGAMWVAIMLLIINVLLNLTKVGLSLKQRSVQAEGQAELMGSISEPMNKADGEDNRLDIPSHHNALAYVPTALAKGLRNVGVIQEKPTIPELIAVFEQLDKNGDGQLDHNEIKEAVAAMGASDEAVDEMIKVADTDGDGKISKIEFLKSLYQKQNV